MKQMKSVKFNKFRAIAISVLGVFLYSAASQADLIRVTPLGVAVDDQTVTEPVPIGSDGFRVSFWGGGNHTHIVDPLILILGTPDGENSSAPGLTYTGNSDPTFDSVSIELGGTNIYGGSWDTTSGLATNPFDGSTDKTAYGTVGFAPDGDDSQNYPNWTGHTTGISSWDLWIYKITFDPDFSKDKNWAEFNTSSLPVGSYVIGYGCTVVSSGHCDKNEGDTQSTPFTYAGLVTHVPEPGAMVLLGAGLLGLGLMRKKRS